MKKRNRERKLPLTELEIIDGFRKKFPSQNHGSHILGMGDDASVVPIGRGRVAVISTDLLIEETHFKTQWSGPEDVAVKAVQVNISDIVAMGATPRYCWLGIGVSRKHCGKWLPRFTRAFAQECRRTGIFLLGGDTCESKNGIFISLTIEGVALRKNIKKRSTFQPGDALMILGFCGSSALGFEMLKRNPHSKSHFADIHRRPKCKEAEGIWLGRQTLVTAMTDLSDGVLADLRRISMSGRIGFDVNMEQIPIHPEFSQQCRNLGLDPDQLILEGGEDYSLLMACSRRHVNVLLRKISSKTREPVAVIGTVTKRRGVRVFKNGVLFPKTLPIFSHFAS